MLASDNTPTKKGSFPAVHPAETEYDTTQSSLWFWLTALILIFSVSVWIGKTLYIVLTSPEHRIQFIPDDTYYYLRLAKNFSEQGVWSFDSGLSVTSGFHLLHAWFLAGLYWLTDLSLERSVSMVLSFSILISALTVLPLLYFCIRKGSLHLALIVGLLLTSQNVILCSVSGIEWPWVVLVATLYSWNFLMIGHIRYRQTIILAASCGFLGSLARSDFGAIPGFLFLVSLISQWVHRDRKLLMIAATGLGSAFLGLAAMFLHNYVTTGDWMQGSAKMKAFWGSFYEPSSFLIRKHVLLMFGLHPHSSVYIPLIVLTACALCAGFALIYRGDAKGWQLRKRRTAETEDSPTAAILWLAGLCMVATYILLYSTNPACQIWYTACLIVPIFNVLTLPFLSANPGRCLRHASLVLCLFMFGYNQYKYSPLRVDVMWPHHQYMRKAALHIAQKPPPTRVGSWNAGFMGYYARGNIVNLDGLVNNQIYQYATTNSLLEYMADMNILHVVDFEGMLTFKKKMQQGGYDHPNLRDCFIALFRFDPGYNKGWSNLNLYRFDVTLARRHGLIPTDESDPQKGFTVIP